MTFRSDPIGARSRPVASVEARRQRPRISPVLVSLAVALTVGAPLVMGPGPVLSQGVQLVRVDVQVVARGYRVSKLTGQAVVNDKNERIGSIDDFVIGRGEGNPLFTIVQVGGFLGLGSHLVAVPFDSLVIDSSANKIELPGASKDQLEKLAQFQYGS